MCFLPGALPSGSDRDSVESEHNRHENVVYPRHLRSYEAFAKADTSFIEDFVSRQEGVLIIGTDPNEWWPGYDTIKRVFEAQMQEMGGVNFVGGDPQAYTEVDLRSPDYDDASERYDVAITGGANNLSIGAW
jgi:hypothetical protein